MKIFFKTKNHKAFTLTELMVTIIIIGVLAAIALPRFSISTENARAGEALQVLSTILESMKVYYFENGQYTNDVDDLSVTIPTMDNFNAPNLSANCSNLVACATVQRNSGGYNYRIGIFENGDLDCQDGATAGICTKLGL